MDLNLAAVIGPVRTDARANSNSRSWKTFVDHINGAWRKGAANFLECGKLLGEAKDELQRNAYDAMLKQLHFDPSVAKKLICIAKNAMLGAHVHQLPPCWSTLYELSKLADNLLKAKFADGTIHPGMQRKHAMALNPKKATAKSTRTKYELAATWRNAPRDQRQRFLDQLGRAELCAAMTTALKADLRDHLVALAVAGASKSSSFAIYSTDKLHVALRCAEQPEPDEESIRHMIAALGCIAKKAQARGITRSDVVIAEGKPRARRK